MSGEYLHFKLSSLSVQENNRFWIYRLRQALCIVLYLLHLNFCLLYLKAAVSVSFSCYLGLSIKWITAYILGSAAVSPAIMTHSSKIIFLNVSICSVKEGVNSLERTLQLIPQYAVIKNRQYLRLQILVSLLCARGFDSEQSYRLWRHSVQPLILQNVSTCSQAEC